MKEIEIYTDGSCQPNPGKGGYGIIIKTNNLRKEISDAYRHTTNNRMELLAVVKALEFLNKNTTSKKFKIKLYTDSRYVTQAFRDNWAFTFKINNFKKNRDLWLELLKQIGSHEIDFIWIKGHDCNEENNHCDKIAKNAIVTCDLKIDKGYEEDHEFNGDEEKE